MSERPEACLLARRQAASGTRLTHRLHYTVDVTDPVVRRFVQLLDGTRTVDDLVVELEGAADRLAAESDPPEISRAAVERNLERVLRLGLPVS